MVAEHLIQQGFSIVTRNFRTKKGEIDIIARKKKLIIFVEVKLRNKSEQCTSDLVNHTKRQKIIATAKQFIATQPSHDTDYRFDIALVSNPNTPHIDYIENAFCGVWW